MANWTEGQRKKAKDESLALFKIQLDFRYAKVLGNGTQRISISGACEDALVEKLRTIIREKQ
jgi:hypothetical protein